MRQSHSLQVLDLSENCIGAEGAADLARALSSNARYGGMQKLNLSHNTLTLEAGREIVQSFGVGSCPSCLNLSHTGIGRAELRQLAAGLRAKNCEVLV
jgi:Ran GTPase-activating protein (RanGAP) involved in mRNA processing and transport